MRKFSARLADTLLRNRSTGRARTVPTALAVLSLAGPLLTLTTGCGSNRLVPVSAVQAGAVLKGNVHGGQQPVSGAQIQLWVAGSTGNASAATPLLTTAVYSDGGGGFDITGDYTCPSATAQVYLTATGGNPGLAAGVNNSSLALMTVLGDCGSLANVPTIQINELTTVAAAYGLAPFSTGVAQVGSTSSNAAGLRSAMLTSMLLADSYTGAVPAAGLPPSATTETAKLITLGNVIGNCVNSDGGTPCSTLASDAGMTGTADTFQMALAVTQQPGSHVAAIFNDAPAHAAYGGALASAPHDWSMSISFTGGGLAQPTAVSVDGSGNLWVSNGFGGVSGFSAQGTPMFAAGVTGSGLTQTTAVMVDANASVWLTNGADASHPSGSVARISQGGSVLSGSGGYTAGAISQPDALAVTAGGNVWVANAGSSSVTLLAQDGSVLSGLNGFGGGLLSSPSAIAVDAAGNAWIANQGSGMLVQMDQSGNILQQSNCGGAPDSLALDRNGTLWVGDSSAGSLTEVRSDGSVAQTLHAMGASNHALAIDGGSHIFVPDSVSGAFAVVYDSSYAAAGTIAGQMLGMGLDAHLNGPYGVAIDASGNLWITSARDNRLVNFVGIAVPVKTVKVGLPVQP